MIMNSLLIGSGFLYKEAVRIWYEKYYYCSFQSLCYFKTKRKPRPRAAAVNFNQVEVHILSSKASKVCTASCWDLKKGQLQGALARKDRSTGTWELNLRRSTTKSNPDADNLLTSPHSATDDSATSIIWDELMWHLYMISQKTEGSLVHDSQMTEQLLIPNPSVITLTRATFSNYGRPWDQNTRYTPLIRHTCPHRKIFLTLGVMVKVSYMQWLKI